MYILNFYLQGQINSKDFIIIILLHATSHRHVWIKGYMQGKCDDEVITSIVNLIFTHLSLGYNFCHIFEFIGGGGLCVEMKLDVGTMQKSSLN